MFTRAHFLLGVTGITVAGATGHHGAVNARQGTIAGSVIAADAPTHVDLSAVPRFVQIVVTRVGTSQPIGTVKYGKIRRGASGAMELPYVVGHVPTETPLHVGAVPTAQGASTAAGGDAASNGISIQKANEGEPNDGYVVVLAATRPFANGCDFTYAGPLRSS